jgi:hypothetical protein
VTLQRGFNLVGNPFPRAAYVNMPYYTLSSDGSAVLTTSESTATAIKPCYGVIVEATSNSETATFTTTAPTQKNAANNGNLQIAVAQTMATRGDASTKNLDNAIVSFNEGEQLGKFYFGSQNANIYLPQNGKEYAIAYSEGQGEVPVNFKAKANGTYTISVNPEGVEMAYLHLIDNLTGADVDLLASPTHIFTAKMTDYESRFKLVFSAQQNGEEADDDFAFISNGEIFVNGEGTLQVIDVTGRVIVSVDGRTRCVPTGAMTPGVYVLRLINGDNVKTQKIVVR